MKHSIVKECHCGSDAHKYRTHKFVNQLGYTVYRIFYRCENCWSGINEDFCPDFDKLSLTDVGKMTIDQIREKLRKTT